MSFAENPVLPARVRALPPEPRILCLGNALKETLGARLALRSLELGVQLGGGTVRGGFCLSDGGDGFLESYEGVVKLRRQRSVVPGPLGDFAVSDFLFDDETQTAVIESAQIIGMALVTPARRDIMNSGTGGLGDVLMAAILMGARRIVVGLGGSATCDGGVGMLYHLQEGLRQGTKIGKHIAAKDLENPPPVDIGFLRERLKNVQIDVFCDVNNVLTGPRGTAFNFAGQKGATRYEMRLLEYLLERWAKRIQMFTDSNVAELEGAGAAGGMGFALAAIGGKLLPGSDAFFDLIGYEKLLGECDGVVTCEGRFDTSSFAGKAPWRAAQVSQMAGKPALIACGSADAAAVEQAALIGVKVAEFARDVPVERQAAEAFTLLQESVRQYVSRRGR